MKAIVFTVAFFFLALPCALPAQQAPRQLDEEDLARLRRGVERNKEASARDAQQATARRQQEELRLQQEALADHHDDGYNGEHDAPLQGGTTSVFDAFIGTLSSEMAKKQQEDEQRQRFLDNVRREAEVVDRQRQRELERQRLADERARLERQAQQQRQQAIAQQQRQSAASGGGPGAVAGSAGRGSTGTAMTVQQQAAKARDDAMRANVAAERKRLAEQRARAEATEGRGASGGPQPAATVVGARPATPASVSSIPKAVAAPVDYGPAKAWCRARRNETAKQTEYQCMGPLQNLLSWYSTLSAPLGMAGCSGGEGYTPTPEHGGSSFNCGRRLKVNDYRMPTYDPYRGGGEPMLVKPGQ